MDSIIAVQNNYDPTILEKQSIVRKDFFWRSIQGNNYNDVSSNKILTNPLNFDYTKLIFLNYSVLYKTYFLISLINNP